MKAVYEDLENANGNDLIDEQGRVWLEIANLIKKAGGDVQLLTDFEELVVELTKREN